MKQKRKMLGRRKAVASPAEWKGLHRVGRRDIILSDQPVREFVDEALGYMTLVETAAACRERFGAERAPSRSTIHRYLKSRQATPGEQAIKAS